MSGKWRMGDPMPVWVERITRWNDDGELVLERKSGRQVIRHGEVIAIDTDGEVVHFVPARQENDDVYPGFRGNNEA